jgi:transcriptional regulator with XRE-family HTH domain
MTSAPVTSADLRRRLAANTRRWRLARTLTIKKAAARTEMHWRHWQKVEAGHTNATLETVVKVADALNVDPAELLREPSPVPGKAR